MSTICEHCARRFGHPEWCPKWKNTTATVTASPTPSEPEAREVHSRASSSSDHPVPGDSTERPVFNGRIPHDTDRLASGEDVSMDRPRMDIPAPIEGAEGETFESWFKREYPLWREGGDTTLKHSLRRAWEAALSAAKLKVEEREWIAVSGRLPNDMDIVQVWGLTEDEDAGWSVAQYDADVKEWRDRFDGGCVTVVEVTHWMPLPAAPIARTLKDHHG